MLFIKAIIQDKLKILEDNKIAVGIDKAWIESETQAQDSIYDNVCRKGYFSMASSSDGDWINFCSAFHRLMPDMFNSWDKVNDFCVKCCKNKDGDNFLYVRNLADFCAFHTIQKKQTAESGKKLIKKAKTLLQESVSEETVKNGFQATATNYLMSMADEISDVDEDYFLDQYIVGSYWGFIFDNNYQHLTAIKNIYKVCYGIDLGKDEADARDYDELVGKIYEYCFSEVFQNNIVKEKIKSYNSLQKELISKFIFVKDDANTEFVFNAVPEEDSDEDIYCQTFNKAVRYFAVLAAMINAQGEAASPGDLKTCVNKFLRECYVRELDENSYDDFDWVVFEAWDYEEGRGTLQDSCGVNTLVAYLQNE